METLKDKRARLGKRLEILGERELKDEDLIESLLCFVGGTDSRAAGKLAVKLQKHFGGVDQLLRASGAELRSIQGMSEDKAFFIQLVGDICRRVAADMDAKLIIDSPNAAADRLSRLFDRLDTELSAGLYLTSDLRFLSCEPIAEGTVSGAEVNLKKVVDTAYETGASAVILCHNHLSGDLCPSSADKYATTELTRYLKSIHITLLDHIVISQSAISYISMADANFFSFDPNPLRDRYIAKGREMENEEEDGG